MKHSNERRIKYALTNKKSLDHANNRFHSKKSSTTVKRIKNKEKIEKSQKF
jgi:hypothetical protein